MATTKQNNTEIKVPVIKPDVAKLGLETTETTITINKLVKNIDNGLWDTDPAYQRKYKWKPKHKNELVTSLLKGIPLPLFYLRNKDGVFEILDGKQRSMTIYNFIKNKFAYNMGNGKLLYFRNLPKADQQDILDTNISLRYLMNATDEDAIDVFLALQNGERVRTEEMRHSLGGNAIEAIKSIIDETNFMSCHAFCKGKDYTKYETIMTKFMYLEHIIEGGVASDIMIDQSLYNMVKAYTTMPIDQTLIDAIISRIDVLTNAYKDTKNVLMPQLPMVYSSYLLAAKLQDMKVMSDQEISNKIVEFAEYVGNLRTDILSSLKDASYVKIYTNKEHIWYHTTMENFGKRGTAKTEVHVYTGWFQGVWDQFIKKFPIVVEQKKRKKLTLFH